MEKNNWQLWLDDQFDDPEMTFRHCPPDFMAARSVQEAKELIRFHGLPKFIDFDHDLGDGHDAPELIHWMYEVGHIYNYEENFVPEYAVHSANPCGRDSIVSLMETWKKVFEKSKLHLKNIEKSCEKNWLMKRARLLERKFLWSLSLLFFVLPMLCIGPRIKILKVSFQNDH